MAETFGNEDQEMWDAGDSPEGEETVPPNVLAADNPGTGRNFRVEEATLVGWIDRVVDRDQQALGQLYDALVGRVYGLALRITERTTLAEEVVEDTFWQVWRQAPRYDPARGAVTAWVMTIARSRALDARRAIDPAECHPDPLDVAGIEATEEPGPPELVSAMEQGHRLHQALAGLDAMPRQLVAMAFLQGLSHEEIAGRAKMPLGTVKSHIRRALIRLREALASDIPSNVVDP